MNWIQSSKCNSNACVQVAQGPEVAVLRDSKDPEGPVLRFSRQAVREFLAAVKAGQFPG